MIMKQVAETKVCPWCAEDVRREAIVCRFCRRDMTHPLDDHQLVKKLRAMPTPFPPPHFSRQLIDDILELRIDLRAIASELRCYRHPMLTLKEAARFIGVPQNAVIRLLTFQTLSFRRWHWRPGALIPRKELIELIDDYVREATRA
jgi:hypothetical protein